MNLFFDDIITFLGEEDGATAVEYAIMLVLIIAVCIAVIGLLGGQVNNSFVRFVTDFESARSS